MKINQSVIVAVIIIALGTFAFGRSMREETDVPNDALSAVSSGANTTEPADSPTPEEKDSAYVPSDDVLPETRPTTTPVAVEPSKPVNAKIPFTSQAPFGEWSDSRFQEGCEEAASLMAVYWARGKALTAQKAKNEIVAMSAYQQKNFDEYRDTSASDTLERLIKGYFEYSDAQLRKNVSAQDIIAEIGKGNIVIAPAAGQRLGNPYFTPPGPMHHALLIHGYDKSTGEFITNDPGTRHGENYRYAQDILYAAIQDYPTGYHEELPAIEKNIIVVSK